jgi:hypothetical protein
MKKVMFFVIVVIITLTSCNSSRVLVVHPSGGRPPVISGAVTQVVVVSGVSIRPFTPYSDVAEGQLNKPPVVDPIWDKRRYSDGSTSCTLVSAAEVGLEVTIAEQIGGVLRTVIIKPRLVDRNGLALGLGDLVEKEYFKGTQTLVHSYPRIIAISRTPHMYGEGYDYYATPY